MFCFGPSASSQKDEPASQARFWAKKRAKKTKTKEIKTSNAFPQNQKPKTNQKKNKRKNQKIQRELQTETRKQLLRLQNSCNMDRKYI